VQQGIQAGMGRARRNAKQWVVRPVCRNL